MAQAGWCARPAHRLGNRKPPGLIKTPTPTAGTLSHEPEARFD